MQQYNQIDGNGLRRAESFETLRKGHYVPIKIDAKLSKALHLGFRCHFSKSETTPGNPARRYFAECKNNEVSLDRKFFLLPMTLLGVRRGKAVLFQGVKVPTG